MCTTRITDRRAAGTREIREAISRQEGIPLSDLKTVVGSGANHLRGTWVHESVALHLAGWLSADFHAFMIKVFRRYISGEITTEESKAAKAVMDRKVERDRIRYEQVQNRLQVTQKELDDTKGRLGGQRTLAENMLKKFQAKEQEAIKFEKQLGTKKATNNKASRTKAKYDFITELRKAVKAYKEGEDVPLEKGDFGCDEDGSPMTVAKFVQAFEAKVQSKYSGGQGREWELFCETPGVGWNIVPVTRADDDAISPEDFCKHTNFFPAPNHPERKRTLQDAGVEFSAEPVPAPKKARRG